MEDQLAAWAGGSIDSFSDRKPTSDCTETHRQPKLRDVDFGHGLWHTVPTCLGEVQGVFRKRSFSGHTRRRRLEEGRAERGNVAPCPRAFEDLVVYDAVATNKNHAARRYSVSWRAVNNMCILVCTEAIGAVELRLPLAVQTELAVPYLLARVGVRGRQIRSRVSSAQYSSS